MIGSPVKAAKTALFAFLLAVGVAAGDARASLLSVASSFGANTATLDTSTGYRWLDVTLSTPYSYDQLLPQLQPGGVFEGYSLGTMNEVLDLWAEAGINLTSLGSFTSANFQPIVDLMALVGITGLNTGNLDNVNFFDFTAGHIEGGPGSGWVWVMTIAADPDPTMTGRPDLGSVPSDNMNNEHGAWLVARTDPTAPVPEPETYAMLLAGLGLLGFMGRRRKQKRTAAT